MATAFFATLSLASFVVAGSALTSRGSDGYMHHHGNCPPLQNGTLTIHQFQLYPDMAVFDTSSCLLYISCLFNGSIAKYDPYQNKVLKIINFPGITDVFDEHASGIHLDQHSGHLSLVIDAQPAFLTGGANATGDYWLVRYDTREEREVWRANLTSVTQAKWAGFQDVTVDARGNSYVIGTYPSSIMKVSKSGKKMTPWYPPQTTNTTVHGFTGVTSLGNTLLVIDADNVPEELSVGDSKIYRFDMANKDVGTPVRVTLSPAETKLNTPDAIHLPEKYDGKVMLAAMNYIGVTVLRSGDGWHTGEILGTIPSDFPAFFQRIIPSTTQIGERIFAVGQWFPGSLVPGTKGGNQSDFELFDITTEVEALLG